MATGNYFDSNRTITEHFHPVILAVPLIDQTEMLQQYSVFFQRCLK